MSNTCIKYNFMLLKHGFYFHITAHPDSQPAHILSHQQLIEDHRSGHIQITSAGFLGAVRT